MEEKTLSHTTVETGNSCLSSRSEVSEEVIAMLGPLLANLPVSSRQEPMMRKLGNWWIAIEQESAPEEDKFKAGLWWHKGATGSPFPQAWQSIGRPAIQLIVEQGDEGKKPHLFCSIEGLIELGDFEAATQAGDIVRCIAWAWLEWMDR